MDETEEHHVKSSKPGSKMGRKKKIKGHMFSIICEARPVS
jgi:hypothetical protein